MTEKMVMGILFSAPIMLRGKEFIIPRQFSKELAAQGGTCATNPPSHLYVVGEVEVMHQKTDRDRPVPINPLKLSAMRKPALPQEANLRDWHLGKRPQSARVRRRRAAEKDNEPSQLPAVSHPALLQPAATTHLHKLASAKGDTDHHAAAEEVVVERHAPLGELGRLFSLAHVQYVRRLRGRRGRGGAGE